MDTLTFIAELVKAFAWPGLVIVLVLILRKPIRDLIPLLTRLKYKDFELEFGREIKQVREEAAIEFPEEEPLEALLGGVDERIYKLAQISPRAAVLESWLAVEQEAIQAAFDEMQQKGHTPAVILPQNAISILRKSERIGSIISAIIRDLRSLRNQAAHAPEFALSSDSALEYALVATRLIKQLKILRGV